MSTLNFSLNFPQNQTKYFIFQGENIIKQNQIIETFFHNKLLLFAYLHII